MQDYEKGQSLIIFDKTNIKKTCKERNDYSSVLTLHITHHQCLVGGFLLVKFTYSGHWCKLFFFFFFTQHAYVFWGFM